VDFDKWKDEDEEKEDDGGDGGGGTSLALCSTDVIKSTVF
jgi:hypothetical protein